MQDSAVTVTMTLRVKAGMEERMRGIMRGLVASSRGLDGCLECQAYESLIYPLVCLLFMRWRDEEAYRSYLDSPHAREFDERWARELLAVPYDLKRWMPLG